MQKFWIPLWRLTLVVLSACGGNGGSNDDGGRSQGGEAGSTHSAPDDGGASGASEVQGGTGGKEDALGTAGVAGTTAPSTRTEHSGLESTAPLSSLSDEQVGALCTWVADYWGGYGTTYPCPDGTNVSLPDASLCTGTAASREACTAKVSDVENCAPLLCQGLIGMATNPSCLALLACNG